MKNILVEITCRNCYYHTHIKSHTLVMPDFEATLRERILNHEMFSYTCPRCGKQILFLHPFLYQDKQHQFLLFMSSEEKDLQELQERFPAYTVRLLHSAEDLAERIRILEDGLDDRILMIVKALLKRKYPKCGRISYHDYDKDSASIWLEFEEQGERDLKGIDRAIYDKYKALYMPMVSSTSTFVIDDAWAEKILQK